MRDRDSMIDVLQVMPDYGLAGAERMSENLSLELNKRGVCVACVSMFDRRTAITDELETAGVHVIYLGKKPGLDLSMVFKFRCLFKRLKPRIIHTHRYCMQYVLPASKGMGLKLIHTVHNVAEKEVPARIQFMQRRAFKTQAATPVAINETVRCSIGRLYGLSEDDIPLVYNGVPNYEPSPVATIPGNPAAFTFLTIGRAEAQKNQMALIRAFVRFHDRYSATKLLIIGDGHLSADIAFEIKSANADSFIFQLGALPNARDYCYAVDAFVLPSLYEGMPMTLVEAMQAGLPVLASRRGGSVDMVSDGVTGYFCEPDQESIARALVRVFEDPRRSEIALAGKRYSDAFTASAMADGYEEVYGL